MKKKDYIINIFIGLINVAMAIWMYSCFTNAKSLAWTIAYFVLGVLNLGIGMYNVAFNTTYLILSCKKDKKK